MKINLRRLVFAGEHFAAQRAVAVRVVAADLIRAVVAVVINGDGVITCLDGYFQKSLNVSGASAGARNVYEEQVAVAVGVNIRLMGKIGLVNFRVCTARQNLVMDYLRRRRLFVRSRA